MVGLRPEQLQAEQPGEKQPELFDIHVLEFGLDAEQVAAGLSGIFGVDAEAARQIALSTPVVVKRASSPAEADRFLDALKPLGAVTVLLPSREAIERVMAEIAAGGAGAPSVDEGPAAQLGRVALKGADAEAPWDPRAQSGVEQASPAALEWDPFGEGGAPTSATLSLPRAPPPLLVRQSKRDDEIEAPPPLLEFDEREEERVPSGVRSVSEAVVSSSGSHGPALDAGVSGYGLLQHGALELLDGTSVGALHGEALLDAPEGLGLEFDVDPMPNSNDELPLQLGAAVPSASGRRPPPPPPSLDFLPELPGLPELPELPELPALPGPSLGAPRSVMPEPPAAAWLTGAGLPPPSGLALPTLGRAGVGGGTPDAHELRRELAANRFALGDEPSGPSATHGPSAFADAGLELDAPRRKPTRRAAAASALPPIDGGVVRAGAALLKASTAEAERGAVRAAREAPTPSETAQRKAAALPKRSPQPAQAAPEPRPSAAGLLLLVGLAVIGAGVYLDRSVLYGNARGAWFLVDGFAFACVVWAVFGAFRATRGRWLAILVSVGAAYAVNVYAKPLVGHDIDGSEGGTRTGEVVIGEGAQQKEFPIVNAHLLVANAQGLLRSYHVRELALRGVVAGEGEPDIALYIEMQDAAAADLATLTPDMKLFVGKELRVRPENTMQDDRSRIAWSGAAKPERVMGGWAVITEALPFDDGRAGPPSWRVAGNLELEIVSADGTPNQLRGRFGARALWDAE